MFHRLKDIDRIPSSFPYTKYMPCVFSCVRPRMKVQTFVCRHFHACLHLQSVNEKKIRLLKLKLLFLFFVIFIVVKRVPKLFYSVYNFSSCSFCISPGWEEEHFYNELLQQRSKSFFSLNFLIIILLCNLIKNELYWWGRS